jgi:hypothetical protein
MHAPEAERWATTQSLFSVLILLGIRYLHALFIGVNANFKLKRKTASNLTQDPSLFNGKAYMVEPESFACYLEEHKGIVQEVCPF